MRKSVILFIVLAMVVLLFLPGGALADQELPHFSTGLLRTKGDFPRLDTAALAHSLQADPPSLVDLSAVLPPVGYQGLQNSCVGWAVGYYGKTLLEQQERGWGTSVTAHQFSPSYVYNQRYTTDCRIDAGMTFCDGLQILQQGAATMADFPYDALDPCTQPSQAVFDAAPPYRIDSFVNIFSGEGSADLLLLKQLLADGHPIAVGVPVYSSFRLITAQDPLVPRPAQGEQYYGGHGLLMVGYDDSIGGFKVVNSWGTLWGQDGFGYLSYDFVQYDAWEAWLMYDFIGTTFSGVVTFNGSEAPGGTKISAWIEGQQMGATTTAGSSYSLDIPADDPATPEKDGAVADDVVCFQIDGILANQTAVWQTGMSGHLDLTANRYMYSPEIWIAKYGLVAGGWTNQEIYPRMLADVDGDGCDDIIGFGDRATYVSLAAEGEFTFPTSWIAFYGPNAGGWNSQDEYPRLLADVTGDGRADIVAFGHRGVQVAPSEGNHFGARTIWISAYGVGAGGWTSQEVYPRLLADVTGDGRADIVAFGHRGVQVAPSEGDHFGARSIWIDTFGVGAGGWLSQNTYPRLLGDVNGDGRADIVAFGHSGIIVSLSEGDHFGARSTWINFYGVGAGDWLSQTEHPRTVADLNGDGRADIVGFGDGAIYVSFSTGTSFEAPVIWYHAKFCQVTGWTDQSVAPRFAADVTGDGRADLVGMGFYGTSVGVTKSSFGLTFAPEVAPEPTEEANAPRAAPALPKEIGETVPELPRAVREGGHPASRR